MAIQEQQPEQLTWTIRRCEDYLVVDVAGEMDMVTVPRLRDAILGLIDERDDVRVAVNLADVSFLDSTALTMFVLAHKAADRHGGVFAVINPNPTALKAIQIGLIDKLLPVLTDVRSDREA